MNKPSPDDVILQGASLVTFPVIRDGSSGMGSVYQMPDGTRYVVFEFLSDSSFGTLKEMLELLGAYERVVAAMKLGLELFLGEDRTSLKH